MSIDIVITTQRWSNDPLAREIIEYLQKKESDLSIEDSVLYYDFPAYVDYQDYNFRPDILLLSKRHGFVAIRLLDNTFFQRSSETLEDIDISLGDFASNLHSRLIKSRSLRKSRTETVVQIHTLIFFNGMEEAEEELESATARSLEGLGSVFNELLANTLTDEQVSEIRSVVEGAKALGRPNKRLVSDPSKTPLAAQLARLENEIINFDEKQRRIALVEVGGPARIRGLAGTGKTVILAMKAAHIHLNNPNSMVLFTFYTKSLRATIKTLITRFYRLYSDTDPDWKRVHIRHGWGGVSIPGVYSDACGRANVSPMRLPEAKRAAKVGETAFGAACSALLATNSVKPYYDHVLIDEGQDFPDSFYKLAYNLTKGERDKKNIVWAYDELQDILNVHIRQPDELFGKDKNGVSVVDLDRSSVRTPPGATNDAVLEKAYRNQRDVLVSAHALGFGVYGSIVQMLEDKEHWEDVGYKVLSGELVVGEPVEIIRPEENSPLLIPEVPGTPIIRSFIADNIVKEIGWVVSQVQGFVNGGLSPDEVLIISLDDRHAKGYFKNISSRLADVGISSNNVIADPYNEPPFSIAEKVTLSTVYRAKGNEAAAVIVVGVDALNVRSRDGRNKLFTAMTRSKAWLRVSGISPQASVICKELEVAEANSPRMIFNMPDLKKIETIQRGFSKKQAAAKAAREKYLKSLKAAGLTDEEIEEEISVGFDVD